MLDQLGSTGNIHWMVPRTVNTLFTGRTALLHRIQQSFLDEHVSVIQTQRRFVITGLGGQGKSEVCLKAVNLMREKYVHTMPDVLSSIHQILKAQMSVR
jgi:hypothetical protein